MTNGDITRLLVQPRKHYVGARMQQGRTILDSDFNEEAALGDEEQRRALADIVGSTGSPGTGFAAALGIGDAVTRQSVSFNGKPPVETLNYRISPGTIYVGGLRFEHEERALGGVAGGDPIVFQRDFLQMRAAEAPQTGDNHSQLSYLHGWQQWVSAAEDEELRERALGDDIDTSLRVRGMARVEVREVANAQDCAGAWEEVRQQIEAEAGGAFDDSGHELLSPARLRVTLVPGEALDPCAPCAPDDVGRYLGANNQTIRIMLAAPDRYVWGFDNASPLYRVELGTAAGGLVPVRMLTEPRDEARWPLVNTVVEFLPWSALLDNGEKVAAEVGVHLRVAEGFDPDTASFQLDVADLPQLDELVRQWDAAHPDLDWLPNDADPDGRYLYLRIWHRLDADTDAVLLDTAAGPTNHALLRRQGLLPEFTGGGRPGDYWVVTVRPNTPQQVTPWNLTLTGGVSPHGPRHVYAPLSLITFRPPGAGEPRTPRWSSPSSTAGGSSGRSSTAAAAARTPWATASIRSATTFRFRPPSTACHRKVARSAFCRVPTPRPSASSAPTSSLRVAGGRRRSRRRPEKPPRHSSTFSRRAWPSANSRSKPRGRSASSPGPRSRAKNRRATTSCSNACSSRRTSARAWAVSRARPSMYGAAGACW